jgi:hypothetical protein
MDIEIIKIPLRLEIHGFSGIAANKDYAGTAFKLMDKMWKAVKTNNLKKLVGLQKCFNFANLFYYVN